MRIQDAQSLMVMALIGVAVGGVLYVMAKGVKGTARQAAGAATDAVGDVLAGTVEGIGESVGIPQTSVSQCCKDIQAGDKWAASFSCPAADYIAWLWNGTKPEGCQ